MNLYYHVKINPHLSDKEIIFFNDISELAKINKLEDSEIGVIFNNEEQDFEILNNNKNLTVELYIFMKKYDIDNKYKNLLREILSYPSLFLHNKLKTDHIKTKVEYSSTNDLRMSLLKLIDIFHEKGILHKLFKKMSIDINSHIFNDIVIGSINDHYYIIEENNLFTADLNEYGIFNKKELTKHVCQEYLKINTMLNYVKLDEVLLNKGQKENKLIKL